MVFSSALKSKSQSLSGRFQRLNITINQSRTFEKYNVSRTFVVRPVKITLEIICLDDLGIDRV